MNTAASNDDPSLDARLPGLTNEEWAVLIFVSAGRWETARKKHPAEFRACWANCWIASDAPFGVALTVAGTKALGPTACR